jgi:hypothetical protein
MSSGSAANGSGSPPIDPTRDRLQRATIAPGSNRPPPLKPGPPSRAFFFPPHPNLVNPLTGSIDRSIPQSTMLHNYD